jgi:DNA-binding transcriptional ArsR family regulator
VSARAKRIDDAFAALADPARRRAVELLARQPRRAGELARTLRVSPSAMSKHLRILRDGGLVTEAHPAHDTRVRIYSLRSAPMADLRAWIDAAARGWTEQLSAFARHLERKP